MRYKKSIASFMIMLVLTLSFYTSSAFAQISVPDPVQSCKEKDDIGRDIADLLENDVISILEKILSLLRTISLAWESVKMIINTIILVLYFILGGQEKATELEYYRNFIGENPFANSQFALMRYLVTCRVGEGLESEFLGVCGMKVDIGVPITITPFDNIYSAIGCLCLPAILFNMRKLQLIYKAHSCCIQEACAKGISTEACDRQFDEAQCMLWGKGALINALMAIILNIVGTLVMQEIVKDWVDKQKPYVGTLLSLANAPFRIQSLIQAAEKISTTFSDPDCEDLGFEEIKESVVGQQRRTNQEYDCRFIPVDTNDDDIYDEMRKICLPKT